MPPPGKPTDLPILARTLLNDGPVRTLATRKRLRIQLGGQFVADTTRGLYVWEHPYYPYYYVPLASLAKGSWEVIKKVEEGRASLLRLSSNSASGANASASTSTERVLAFSDDIGGSDGEVKTEQQGGKGAIAALRGMVRVEFGAADAWFEEDTRIYVHPKDPFKRIEIVHSTRPVVVLVHGRVVARATSALHLFETGLPRRFYLPPTSVDPAVLRPSDTVTQCPYKGDAEYYDVVVGEEVAKDVVWYYRNPTQESALIAGALCFYNEKVDIELDGEKLERPKTPFS